MIGRSEVRVSAFGVVKSTLELVREQFRKLNDVSDLKAFTTETSDSNITATGSSSAITDRFRFPFLSWPIEIHLHSMGSIQKQRL